MKKYFQKNLLTFVWILLSIVTFGQNKGAGKQRVLGAVYKQESISDIQVDQLTQAGLEIPLDGLVINQYQMINNQLVLNRTSVDYNESDKKDGVLYFGEYVSYAVIILNKENKIIFHQSVGKALSEDCLIDLKMQVKISYDYSSMTEGESGFQYLYLSGEELLDKKIQNELKVKHNFYFNGNKFWDLVEKFVVK
jgi:hypothetical protein